MNAERIADSFFCLVGLIIGGVALIVCFIPWLVSSIVEAWKRRSDRWSHR